ncbi:MAG: thymidine kinase [Muribaculaceae bacterium]|nr:thymidine kinase [Muribaculaceae bacterium]
MNRIAKLYFRYGTMGSAKTALLLTTAYNFEERGLNHMCFKPIVDTRDRKNVIRSRIGIERECKWIYADTNLYLMMQKMLAEAPEDAPSWLLVDEAQFLTSEQVDQLAAVVDDFGINVICYGLRTDFKGNLFEGSKRLFEMADTIDEVKSTCTCGRKTIMNARIDSEGEIITEGEQVEIGGNDRYMACCRKCWRNKRIERMSRYRLPFPEVILTPPVGGN